MADDTNLPPGSRVTLPPPRPLRTARASFPASSSRLSNAPWGTRFHNGESLAMGTLMARGVKQHTVGCLVAAAFGPPDDVVGMPSCRRSDRLAAEWADAVLLLPEAEEQSLTDEGVLHGRAEALLEVHLVGGIVRVGLAADLDVPRDRQGRGEEKPHAPELPLRRRDGAVEPPLTCALHAEVFLPHPGRPFLGVTAPRPAPQGFEDGIVHGLEGLRAHHVPMIQRPAPDHGVEQQNQVAGSGLLVLRDDLSDFVQERRDVLRGRSDEQRPLVLADVVG